jgi:hypothetical protein
MIDDIQRWSRLAGLTASVTDVGPPLRIQLQLTDIRPPMTVDVLGPTGPDDPYRFSTGFDLPAGAASALPGARIAEIVEAAVLQRSALADARRRPDGSGVEMIAVIYPDAPPPGGGAGTFSRHTFMTAIYECQKLRQIITRDIESAAVSEAALANLLALSESSDQLATSVTAAVDAYTDPPAPGPAPPSVPAASSPAPAPAPSPPLPSEVPFVPPPLPNVPPPLPPT